MATTNSPATTCHHLLLKKIGMPGGPAYKCQDCGENFCVPDQVISNGVVEFVDAVVMLETTLRCAESEMATTNSPATTCHHLLLKKIGMPGGPAYKCQDCGENFCVPAPLVIRVIEDPSSNSESGA